MTTLSPSETRATATVDVARDQLTPQAGYGLAVLRIMLGWYFLWAFLDKTFGLTFSTPSENAWINGGSPTTGYLSGVEGPFAGIFNSMAGGAIWDWLFQLGLLGIGLALILGIGIRIGAASATAMLLLMYLAALPLVTNPIIDDHIVMALAAIVVALTRSGRFLGLGTWWERLPLVQKQRWLI